METRAAILPVAGLPRLVQPEYLRCPFFFLGRVRSAHFLASETSCVLFSFLGKAWRSLGSPTPDTAVWGHSPDVPVGRDGDRQDERGWLVEPFTASLVSLKRRSPSGPWKLCLDCPPQFQHGSLFSFPFLFPVNERLRVGK